MSIKKALFGGGVETSATASYQGSIQDWLPVKNIIGGVVITKDNRFIKILEIVPVNIYLKSAEDRQAIVEAFAACADCRFAAVKPCCSHLFLKGFTYCSPSLTLKGHFEAGIL